MNRVKLTMIAAILINFVLLSHAQALSPAEDAIAERIRPVGEICVAGKACAELSVAQRQPSSNSNSRGNSSTDNILSNFNKSCATCHATGIAGAPKLGASDDWAPLIAKGKDALYQSAINGLPPAMPAKGMCFSCSEDDLKALVDYMVENSQ